MRELTLSKASRLYEHYARCLRLWAVFTDRPYLLTQHDGADDLCHFVRVMLIYAPTAIACQAIFVAAPIYVAVVQPILWFGAASYAIGIGKFVAITALISLAVWSIYRLGAGPRSTTLIAATSRPGRLIIAYFEAKLRDYCPRISFKEGE